MITYTELIYIKQKKLSIKKKIWKIIPFKQRGYTQQLGFKHVLSRSWSAHKFSVSIIRSNTACFSDHFNGHYANWDLLMKWLKVHTASLLRIRQNWRKFGRDFKGHLAGNGIWLALKVGNKKMSLYLTLKRFMKYLKMCTIVMATILYILFLLVEFAG